MCDPATFTALGMSAAAAETAAGVASVIGTVATIGGTVMSVVGARQQAQAQQDQAQYQAAVARNNQAISERNAADVERRGEEASRKQKLQTRMLIEEQRVGAAAQGFDTTFGSNVDIFGDTAEIGKIEEGVTRENFSREADRIRTVGMNQGAQAGLFETQASSYNPNQVAFTTALAGAGDIAAKWYRNA